MERTKPIHVAKSGLVEAAVFENLAENGGRYYRVTFSRLYKNADGKWRNRTGFSPGDLADLMLAASKAALALEPLLEKSKSDESESQQAVNS